MFDLKYYNELSRETQYFDKFKGTVWSRQNLHEKITKENLSKKQIMNKLIEELPETDLKDIIGYYYNKKGKGQKGLKELFQ